jgi:hypothetical protein
MHHTTVLDADPDAVWAEVRDVVRLVKILFGDTVEDVRWTEDGAVERVPSRYQFTLLPTKDVVHQEVAGRNEVDRSVTYRTVGKALCIYEYVATYRVLPVTNDPGRCFLEYVREYKLTDDAVPEVVEALVGMMDNQINVIHDYFAQPPTGN